MTVDIVLFSSNWVEFDLDTIRPCFMNTAGVNDFVTDRINERDTRSLYIPSANFKAIGSPMIIPTNYRAAAENYDIGAVRITSNPTSDSSSMTSRWYLFRVRDIIVNELNQTEIIYDIDYAASIPEALRGGGVVTRVPKGHELARGMTLNPRYWQYEDIQLFRNSGSVIGLVLTQMKSTPSASTYDVAGPVYVIIDGNWVSDGPVYSNIIQECIDAGYFLAGDIVNAWTLPAFPSRQEFAKPEYWSDVASFSHVTKFYYTNKQYLAAWNVSVTLSEAIGGTSTADGYVEGVCDERGNVLFMFPDQRNITAELFIGYNMSMSSCDIDIVFNDREYDDTGQNEQIRFIAGHTSNLMMTYSCRPVDVICNTWQEYLFRQRDADIQNRRIQNASALSGSVTNAMTGALTGAVTGSAVPGVGTVAGAAAGLAAGLLGTFVDYGLSAYYGDMQQQVTDQVYRLAQDTVAVNGMNSSRQIIDPIVLIIFRVKVDDVYKEELDEMVAQIGVPANGHVNDMQYVLQYICTQGGGEPQPFAGVPEVALMGMPSAWRRQIRDTYAAGARYILVI